MKLKQFLLPVSIMLYGASMVHASDLTTSMTTASTNLASAQTTLASLMGISNPNASININSVSMVKNSSKITVFLIMYDANKQEINPTTILLAPGAFSYIPVNTTLVKVVNYSHKQLVAPTTVAENTLYTVTYNSADLVAPWSLVSSPSTPLTNAYTYKNSTTIPLIVTITTANSMKENQQLIPGATYSKQIVPLSAMTIEAHANISPIYSAYNAAASYSITIGANNKLTLTQTSATGSILINKSGWPMLIGVTTLSATTAPIFATLADKSQIQPNAGVNSIMIIPTVINNISGDSAGTTKSCNIVHSSGQLAVQLS